MRGARRFRNGSWPANSRWASSPRTTLPSFNSRRSSYGCALMNPRP